MSAPSFPSTPASLNVQIVADLVTLAEAWRSVDAALVAEAPVRKRGRRGGRRGKGKDAASP